MDSWTGTPRTQKSSLRPSVGEEAEHRDSSEETAPSLQAGRLESTGHNHTLIYASLNISGKEKRWEKQVVRPQKVSSNQIINGIHFVSYEHLEILLLEAIRNC